MQTAELAPPTHMHDALIEVRPDIGCQQILFVNVYFVGTPGGGDLPPGTACQCMARP